jgi:hypothetical protein
VKAKRFTAERADSVDTEVVLAAEAEAEIAALKKERDEARAALAVPHDSSINHPHEYAPDYREMYHTERGCAMKMMRGKQDAETLVVSLRAELDQAKAQVGRLAMDQHNCSAEAALVYHLVSAPSDEDLEAIVGSMQSLGLVTQQPAWGFGVNHAHDDPDAGDARTILSAVADLARAKETTL